MRRAPRFFASSLPPAQRRVYRAATVWFVLASAVMIWPLYPYFARVRPLVLGMPFGLFWLALVCVASFAVAAGLYAWESSRGIVEKPEALEGGTEPRSSR